MHDLTPPRRPAWATPLMAAVEAAFAVTGAATPPWPDRHPDREPSDEEYSRCLDPGKYQILETRLDAWSQALARAGLATTSDQEPTEWIGAARSAAEIDRERRITPAVPGGLIVLAASTLVGGQPFGLDLGVMSNDEPAVLLELVPHCGCDACDSGSADLLEELDDWILSVARGGVLHARGRAMTATRIMDGYASSGLGPDDPVAWLDEASSPPPDVRRWIGAPWTT